ncbi:hypothetical protein SmJEL517_g06291 [Synchytrium microbalum]|uniref:Uncharacterized protein n=1 Tax=Synchytrium microbalum TaxID=1806994 RepID=A0A507BS94_9FUNG|nr:uncharacterized protein SmJEL517_g06291 [Synchytrium microbalum]TPX30029.1 hypothetical protein SmJEL517_g06291 [Synchytrium microbalum]
MGDSSTTEAPPLQQNSRVFTNETRPPAVPPVAFREFKSFNAMVTAKNQPQYDLTWKFPFLDQAGTNWTLWERTMMDKITSSRLQPYLQLNICDATRKFDALTSDNPTDIDLHFLHLERMLKLKELIRGGLDETFQVLINQLDNPPDIWSRLKLQCEVNSEHTRTLNIKKWQDLKISGYENIHEYTSIERNLVDTLSKPMMGMTELVTDQMRVDKMKHTMPSTPGAKRVLDHIVFSPQDKIFTPADILNLITCFTDQYGNKEFFGDKATPAIPKIGQEMTQSAAITAKKSGKRKDNKKPPLLGAKADTAKVTKKAAPEVKSTKHCDLCYASGKYRYDNHTTSGCGNPSVKSNPTKDNSSISDVDEEADVCKFCNKGKHALQKCYMLQRLINERNEAAKKNPRTAINNITIGDDSASDRSKRNQAKAKVQSHFEQFGFPAKFLKSTTDFEDDDYHMHT